MDGFCYLASPYSHPEESVRRRRAEQAVKMAAQMMLAGEHVFCPIAHSHEIGLQINRPVDHDFWMLQDLPILNHASKMTILRLEGWADSRGISDETIFCKRNGIPIDFADYGVELDKSETILEEAQRIVYGDRQANYGHPMDDYTRTAAMVSGMLAHKLKEPLSAEDMALVMCQVKISRQVNKPKRDSMVDLAGYAACVQRIVDRRGGLGDA